MARKASAQNGKMAHCEKDQLKRKTMSMGIVIENMAKIVYDCLVHARQHLIAKFGLEAITTPTGSTSLL